MSEDDDENKLLKACKQLTEALKAERLPAVCIEDNVARKSLK